MSKALKTGKPDLAARVEASLDRLMASTEMAARVEANEIADEDLDRLYDEARQAMVDGRIDAALDGFSTLAVAAPGKPEHQFGFALCLQHFGRLEDAGRHFSAALALDPSDAACAYRLGECLAGCGYLDDARDALNSALALCRLPDCDPGIAPLAESLLDRLA